MTLFFYAFHLPHLPLALAIACFYLPSLAARLNNGCPLWKGTFFIRIFALAFGRMYNV